MTPNRRLAAIHAADVVGYSRLMGVDEAGTLQALKALRAEIVDPKVAEHKGRVFKATGDGVLAEFPSVVNAVSRAVEIQRAMTGRPLQLRIGVHLGDVIVEEGDIFGDGVNLAARVEGVAPPGGVALSASAFEHVGNRLGLAFEDMGEQSLKNIDRPVRVYRVNIDGAAAVAPAAAWPIAATVEKPSIAVLPFSNMSGDPEQDYFADGITEDIITELSRNRGLFVIARNSTFAFKGIAVDIAEVGRKLGVRYVVEGSVRKAGKRVRITAQLIEAATGSHIWAERYDRDLEDIFAVQDEVTRSIVVSIPGHLESDLVKATRHKPTESLSAYDHYLRGVEILNRWRSDEVDLAEAEFESAVKLDPHFARGHAGVGHIHLRRYWQTLDQHHLKEAGRETGLAVQLDSTDSRCLGVTAWFHLSSGDFDATLDTLQRALHLSPNDPWLHQTMAYYLIYSGQGDEALEWLAKAARASPIILLPSHREAIGMAHMVTQRYLDAAKTFLAIPSPDYYVHVYAASCLAKLGHLDEARAQARLASAQNPEWPTQDWRGEYRYPEDRDHIGRLLELAIAAVKEDPAIS